MTDKPRSFNALIMDSLYLLQENLQKEYGHRISEKMTVHATFTVDSGTLRSALLLSCSCDIIPITGDGK